MLDFCRFLINVSYTSALSYDAGLTCAKMQITDFRFETKSIGQVRNAFSYHIKRPLQIVLCTGGAKFKTPAQRVQNQSV